jgi:glycine cleavage system H protein
MSSPAEPIHYRRSRFSTRLPADRRYTAAHQWLREDPAGTWRVGYTKFATRMLGDLVELGWSVAAGDSVEVGQTIGWVEGFKAVTDLFCVLEGEFAGANPELEADVTLIDTDPYGRGWLYSVRGRPELESIDVTGYVELLDRTIDRMLEKQSSERPHDG